MNNRPTAPHPLDLKRPEDARRLMLAYGHRYTQLLEQTAPDRVKASTGARG